MVDFTLSEQERAVKRTAREFAETEIAPVARHHEETGEWPEAVWEKAVETGLVGGTIPEEYGGVGLSQVETFCDEHDGLAGYEKPRRVAFVDSFPRTGSQKVDKAALSAELEWG